MNVRMKFLMFLVIGLVVFPGTSAAVTIFDMEFTGEVLNGSGSYTLLNPGVRTQSGNNSNYRLKTVNPLEGGDFTIYVTGHAYASGSYLSTHIKHYLGLVQFNHAAANDTERLLAFSGNSGNIFSSDTHYRVDLNNEIGLNTSFSLRFSKSGTTVTTAQEVGGSFQIINSYTMSDPSANLYFEFVETDGTSSASGYTDYNTLNSVPEPSCLALLGFILSAVFGYQYTRSNERN